METQVMIDPDQAEVNRQESQRCLTRFRSTRENTSGFSADQERKRKTEENNDGKISGLKLSKLEP